MSQLDAAAALDGQGLRQIGELLLAFALSSVIGFERQFRGKSAGLRTQAIVGTASALILLVSKYGFADVLTSEPRHAGSLPGRGADRVGVGFLGAGLIITRRGAIRGLTTAAAVWETAAIGMAAGAGLAVLALIVTALHFVIVLGFTPLSRVIATRGHGERGYSITYEDGRGILRALLETCTANAWTVVSMAIVGRDDTDGRGRRAESLVTVSLTLRGRGAVEAAPTLGTVPGVVRIDPGEDEDE